MEEAGRRLAKLDMGMVYTRFHCHYITNYKIQIAKRGE